MLFRKKRYLKPQKTTELSKRRRLSSEEQSARGGSEQFRRNKNLASRQYTDNSPRSQIHKLKKRQRSLASRLLMILGMIAILCFILYQLIADVSVSVYGAVDPKIDEYKAKYVRSINQYFADHPLERLRIFANVDGMTKSIQLDGHSEIKSINKVSFQSIGKAWIDIKLREPVARWTINGQPQFVDNTGTIFAHNYYKSPNVSIVDKSGIDVDDRRKITSKRFLRSVGKTMGRFDKYGYKIKQIIIPANTTRQVWYDLVGIGIVKTAIDRPVGEQTEDAHRAIQYLRKKRQKVKYIDTRVSGRAYYK